MLKFIGVNDRAFLYFDYILSFDLLHIEKAMCAIFEFSVLKSVKYRFYFVC